MRFTGQTVIITGASLGVGRACAHRFHAEGAIVVLMARREGPLREVEAELGTDRVLVAPADVADNAALQQVVDAALERFGAIHGLVNNAGAHFRGPLADRTPDEMGIMVDVNLRGPIVLTRMVLPQLLQTSGFVVNVASLAGKIPLDGAVVYSSTKWGLRAFSFALAEELRETGVRVSAVSPGPIDTGFILDDLEHVADITFSQTMCSADDVATMVLDCAQDGRRDGSSRHWAASWPRSAT